MAQYSFEAQVENRKQLLQELAPPVLNASAATPAYPVPHPVEKELSNKRTHASVPSHQALDLQKVEGYKMEKNRKKKDTTRMTSSGVQWTAILLVLHILALFALGTRRNQTPYGVNDMTWVQMTMPVYFRTNLNLFDKNTRVLCFLLKS